jgi:hypothetical protein
MQEKEEEEEVGDENEENLPRVTLGQLKADKKGAVSSIRKGISSLPLTLSSYHLFSLPPLGTKR